MHRRLLCYLLCCILYSVLDPKTLYMPFCHSHPEISVFFCFFFFKTYSVVAWKSSVGSLKGSWSVQQGLQLKRLVKTDLDL